MQTEGRCLTFDQWWLVFTFTMKLDAQVLRIQTAVRAETDLRTPSLHTRQLKREHSTSKPPLHTTSSSTKPRSLSFATQTTKWDEIFEVKKPKVCEV